MKTFIDLIQQFNIRTNTPKQIAIVPTDNNNQFVACFASALAKIQSDHNWPAAAVLEYAITGDGASYEFDLPSDFVNLITPQVYNHSVNAPLQVGSVEEILRARMLQLKGDAILLYTIIDGKIIFSFAPQEGSKITFGYWSDGLVLNYNYITDDYSPGSSFVNTKDKFRIDDELILLGAQYIYAQQMGFQDESQLEQRYNGRLRFVIRRQHPPFIKSLNGARGTNPLAKKLAAVEVLTQPYGW